MIRLHVPPLDESDFEAVRAVLATGNLVQGPHVAEFEQAFARIVGVEHAIAVTNCTAALHLSLLALDVGPGDLVPVAAYSWPATANVIELCGAQPVFVDADPQTHTMDPDGLAATLDRLMADAATRNRVRAVLPVHAFGRMADMPAILEVAGRYDVPVLEDAACALGADLAGRQAGSWGALGCFSFHPRKALTTGEGGMITTSDANLARRLRALRNHGLDPTAAGPDFILPGFNCRMTEFQAALGMSQLARFDDILADRRAKAAHYDGLLAGSPVMPPARVSGQTPVHQSYVVMLPAEAAGRRSAIIQALKAHGIETTIGTWHLPLTTYFRTRYGARVGDFPGTDLAFERSLTLPLHHRLTHADQAFVVRHLIEQVTRTSLAA
jgi:perosamine synthetase